MSPPNDTQKGAFFGLLAAGLVVILTLMAVAATDQNPAPHLGRAHYAEMAVQPTAPEQGR